MSLTLGLSEEEAEAETGAVGRSGPFAVYVTPTYPSLVVVWDIPTDETR